VQLVRRQALAGVLAQVTQGAAGVGLILVVRQQTGSLALAGVVVGVLSAVAGIGRPIQGKLIDQRGTRGLMALCGLVHPAALAGIVGLAHEHAPGITLVALGALAGLALPPVSTSMRVRWGRIVPEDERTAAYSLVYLTQELSILVGPLLLAALIAAANASVALLAVATLAGLGTLAFAALSSPDPGDRDVPSSPPPGALLRNRGMRALVGVAALTGAVIGALEVAIPTFATEHRTPAATGLLIAALSIGGICGAVIYGSRRWHAGPAMRLLLLLAGLTIAVALMIPVASVVLLGALLLLAGGPLNPSLTTISLLVDGQIPPSSAAEAFGWLSFGVAGGTGAANAVAGALTHAGQPRTAFVVAAVAAAAATTLGYQGRKMRAVEEDRVVRV
jgi:MFS family permease